MPINNTKNCNKTLDSNKNKLNSKIILIFNLHLAFRVLRQKFGGHEF